MTKINRNNKTKTKSNNNLKKTRRNNKSIVSRKKHIFGKVYADWCGACNGLLPKWMKMLHQLKGKEWKNIPEEKKQEEMKKSIFIDKNGTVLEIIQIQDSDYDSYKSRRPELSSLEATGYPTIFRKIEDSPIEYYNGDRSPEDMISWALSANSAPIKIENKILPIMGGNKKSHSKHNKTEKKHKKTCSACNSGFSQTISNFWGWK
jgi:thiol-disulfide isomerase/thioredoxin